MMDTPDKAIKGSYVFWWIAAALAIRLVAMLACLHSDIVFVNFFPSKLAYEGVWGIYHYIDVNFAGDRIWSYYPPLTYFTIGAFQWLFKPLAGGFQPWIGQVFSMGLDKWMLQNALSPEFFKYLFLMKAPYLVFDSICLFAIMGLLKGSRPRSQALALWAVNPVIIYGIYIFGQADIMPAALAVMAVMFIARGKCFPGFMLLGLAALFKTFTLFMIPPLIILTSRSWKDAAKNLLAAAVPFVLVVPFMGDGGDGLLRAFFPKAYVIGQGMGGGWPFVRKAVFAGFYFVLLLAGLGKRGKAQDTYVVGAALASVLLLYTIFFTSVHYFVWAMPLLIAAVCLGVVSKRLYWSLVALLFVCNLNSERTTTWLLAPLNPTFFFGIPGLPDIMHGYGIKWGYVMLGAELAFVALCVMTAMALAGVAPGIGSLLGIKENRSQTF